MINYQKDISSTSYTKLALGGGWGDSMQFKVIECGCFELNRGIFIESSGGIGFLLFYTISGRGTIVIENDSYELGSGSAIIIDCNAYHRCQTEGDESWSFRWMNFDGAGAKRFENLLGMDGKRIQTLNDNTDIRVHLDLLEVYMDQKSILNDARISYLISEILTALLFVKMHRHKDFLEGARYGLKYAVKYMNQYYFEKINVDLLAQKTCLSKYYFIRTFNEEYGQTPYDYLTGIRIREVQILLRTGDMTLDEIASKTGFSNSKNLIKNFKNKTGITPSQYKKDNFKL